MPEEAKKEPEKKQPDKTCAENVKKMVQAAKKVEKVSEEAKKEAPPIQNLLHTKKSDKVAIVGFAPTSKDLAPFQDPGVEIWGCNELYNHVPRLDVLFEIHDRKAWGKDFGSQYGPKHTEAMSKMKIPIYMTAHHDDIPTSIPLPINQLINAFRTNYYTNTISFQIALALYMQYKWIGIYGVDMAHATEYGTQRPSCEIFIGMILMYQVMKGWPQLVIPPESDLLKSAYLYGYQNESKVKQIINAKIAHFTKQQNIYANQQQQARDIMQQYLGATQALHDLNRTDIHG
jgi:hypothetical protein